MGAIRDAPKERRDSGQSDFFKGNPLGRAGLRRRAGGGGSSFPRQEFGGPALRCLGDLGKTVGEPSLRIDVVELCGLNQRAHDRGRAQPRALSRRRAMIFGPRPGRAALVPPRCS